MALPNPFLAAAARSGRLAPNAVDPITGDGGGLLSAVKPALSGLGWVGETLDKPGRVVRGGLHSLGNLLSGGDPWRGAREMLNVLPGSDTLGITDPSQAVTGRDLLTGLGITPKNDERWSLEDLPYDTLGFAADVLLDPLTYMTFGASAGGKAAKVAKAVGAFEPAMAKAATKGMGKAMARLKTTLGEALNEIPDGMAKAQRYADEQGLHLGDLLNQPLGGPIGIGKPFASPSFIPSGPKAEALAKGMDWLGGKIGNFAPVRHGRALFNSAVRGFSSIGGQALGPILHAAEGGAEEIARGAENAFVRVVDKHKDIISEDVLRHIAEGGGAGEIVGFHASPGDISGSLIPSRGRAFGEPTGIFFAPTKKLAKVATGKGAKKITGWTILPKKVMDLADPVAANIYEAISKNAYDEAIQAAAKATGMPADETLLDIAKAMADNGQIPHPQDVITEGLLARGYDAVRYGKDVGQGQVVALTPDIVRKGISPTLKAVRKLPKAARMEIKGAFDELWSVFKDLNKQAIRFGLDQKEFYDPYKRLGKYFPRFVDQALPRSGDEVADAVRSVRTADSSRKARMEMFSGMTTGEINDMIRATSGKSRKGIFEFLSGPKIKSGLSKKIREALKEAASLSDDKKKIFEEAVGDLKGFVKENGVKNLRGNAAQGMRKRLLDAGLKKGGGLDLLLESVESEGFLRKIGLPDTFDTWDSTAGKLIQKGKRARQIARYVDNLSPETRNAGLFPNEVVTDAGTRIRAGKRSVGMAEATIEALSNREFLGLDKGGETVRLADALESMGLKGVNVHRAALAKLKKQFMPDKTMAELGHIYRTPKSAVAKLVELGGNVQKPEEIMALLKTEAPGALREILRRKHVAFYKGQKNAPKFKVTEQALAQLAETPVPKALANDLKRTLEGVDLPESANAILEGIDKFTNLFKAGVLTAPARYTRDMISGLFRSVETGAIKPHRIVQALGGAWQTITGQNIDDALQIPAVRDFLKASGRAATPEEATRVVREMARQFDVVSHFQGKHVPAGSVLKRGAKDILQQMPGEREAFSFGNMANQFLGEKGTAGTKWNPFKATMRGVRGDVTSFAPAAIGESAGYLTESMNRLAPWLEYLRQGMDPKAAAELVKNAQLDYGARAFTGFERDVMMRLMPFYRFFRGNTPFVMRELAERPGGILAQTIKAQTRMQQDSGPVPDELAGGTAIPLGTNADGSPRYLTSLGLMHEDPLSLFGNSPQGMMLDLGSSLNPVIKAPLEFMTGRSFFQSGPSGARDIEDLDPVIGRIRDNLLYGSKGNFKQAEPIFGMPSAEFLLSNSPLSRALTTTRTLTDPRKSALGKALNTLTGMRVTDVSPARQDAIRREALTKLIESSPAGKVFEVASIDKDILATLPEKEQKKLLEYKLAMELLVRRANARKEAKKKR